MLGLEELERPTIASLLDRALTLKRDVLKSPTRKTGVLRGKSFVNLFFEPSTRTRSSFELAGKYLGADVINVQDKGSSVEKGETLYDTVRTIQAMAVDALVIRHPASGVPAQLQPLLRIPVVNAGDGTHEHPTQGLLDLMTVLESRGTLQGAHLVIVGDVLHSRVARSDLWGFLQMGGRVTLVGPRMWLPEGIDDPRVELTEDLAHALGDADAVQVLRIQKERRSLSGMPSMDEYRRRWGLTAQVAKTLSDDVLILHPGPQNRGVEIDSDVMDRPQSRILDQVENGVAVRMAVLERLMGGQHE